MVVGEGQRKEQGKRTTERKGITRVWKVFLQTKMLISSQTLTDGCSFIDLHVQQGISPSPSENRGLN